MSRFPQVAVGRIGRTTVLVSKNPVSQTLSLMRFGKRFSHRLVEGEYEPLDLRTRPLFQFGRLSLSAWHEGQKPGLYLLDEASSLLRLFVDQNDKRCCEVVHSHALALTRARSGLCYAAYEAKDGGHVRVYVDGHVAPIHWSEPEVPSRAFFGYGPLATSLPFGLLALGHEDYWDICHLRGRTKIEVPRTFTVHGVMQDESYEETLIVVEGEGKAQTLGLHGAHGTRRLVKTDTPITAVCGCQQLPFIAYATDAGEISVYSLKHGKAVLDFARSAK